MTGIHPAPTGPADPADPEDLSQTAAAQEADPAAVAHFTERLRFETDASDLFTDVAAGAAITVVDSRGDAAWAQGRIDGAVHLPTASISTRAAEVIPSGHAVVVYCWGPGCNGGTKAALAFAKLGYPVKELLGGFEYWAREGYPVATDHGVSRRSVDPLTGPVTATVAGISCDC